MAVKPNPTKLFQTCQDLEAFLFNCQKRSLEKCQPHWISLSWELPAIDPLVAFSRLFDGGEQLFYLENPNQNTAVAAVGTACHLNVDDKNRFDVAREFVETCLDRAIVGGDSQSPDSGMRFFCSFTFFERTSDRDAPFPAATVFLPRWQISRRGRHSTAVCNLRLDANSNLDRLTRQIWRVLRDLRSLGCRSLTQRSPKRSQTDFRYIDRFKQSVEKALDAIATQSLQKVVLSHAIDLQASSPYNLTGTLNNLRHLYPDCYTFAVGNGRGQQFIGASPERLLQIRDGELLADALAGSAPRGITTTADAHLANSLLCNPKELHEHRVVLHFIQEHLQDLGLTLHPIPPMRLLQLSNIQHLWTPVQATVPDGVHPLQVLERLHPTPAVAGVPRSLACDAIRQWEPFDRQLYAAPLGWLDGDGNGEFVVGIRSALLDGDRARLYAGAGIVHGSDPEKELAEIQLKFQALLKALA
ncbi:isochorismate synthase [Baaleninema simplex]|uniref:isochorismate synthase n=1 Tax=Baaleninema simplex TaxID=2862350 RepID=UPI000360211C|nr:isochorismate synthase [Baaleninema simplex]